MLTRNWVVGTALATLVLVPPLAWASDVAPAYTTATYSQGGFPVTNIIDFSATSGWAADNAGTTSTQTAFIESATHFGMLGNNALTFNIAHNSTNNQHGVGKFRLSYTTDEGTLGASSAWKILTPETASSTGGSTLTINPDGSILASGTNPATDTYTVTANLPITAVNATGFRLEALEDLSLPTNGPGRYVTNGNFVMTDFAANVSSRIGLQQATSTFSQTDCCGDGGLLIAKTINGISGYNVNGVQEGWGFGGGAPATVDAAYETATDVGFVGGTKLRFGIDHRMFANHNLANVKFYVTGDDRSTFADGVSTGGDPLGTATWTQIVPLRATSEGGALVSIGATNTMTFGGVNSVIDTYTIEAISPIANVTGIRMEIVGTKGRGTGGNAVVSELTLDAVATQLVPLTNPSVTFQQGAPYQIGNTINGNYHAAGEGWGVFGGQTSNQAAVFQTTTPLNDAGTLTFTMIHALGTSHNIQKFRLSATADANPDATGSFNWTILDPRLVFLDNGSTYSIDANSIITVIGAADVDRYTIMAPNSLQGITGFRLEVFTGDNGNLGFAANGNFVLNEFVVEASPITIPEPGTFVMLIVGLIGLMLLRRR